MFMRLLTVAFWALLSASVFCQEKQPTHWQAYRGKAGPTGWRCHVVQPDPHDDGPDGINIHDWDGDGDLDLFVNAEEGKYSRLYFNPGPNRIRETWDDFIEFRHGPCEDSGIGDLDADGDVDYVANGGRVYFNPGAAKVRVRDAWTTMVLFEYERRVPTVFDVDGDGRKDLIVGAQAWYQQPATRKHDATSWKKYVIGKNRWPMNCILSDVDLDGNADLVVPDRGVETCWYQNPGHDRLKQPWPRRTLHSHIEPMFMAVADVNGDQLNDFVITGGSRGEHARQLLILIRTNTHGDPQYRELVVDQPCGLFPKGVAVADLDNQPSTREIIVVPKSGDLWIARVSTTGSDDQVSVERVAVPGALTRKKMDNAWLGDLDQDGDLDVVTTEENGGWGVIWFENPAR